MSARNQHETDAPFFIVGVPRSGTTLLQSMLNAHPRLWVPPETEIFMQLGCAPSPVPAPALDRWLSSARFADQGFDRAEFERRLATTPRSAADVFSLLCALHRERTGKARIGEKSPHHCRSVEGIAALLPEAVFIHLLRDPRDAVASRLSVPWSKAGHLAVAREWKKIIADHLRLSATMPRERYLTVRYEALVREPEITIGSVCGFLGESCDASALVRERSGGGFTQREREWKANAEAAVSTGSVGAYRQRLTARQIHDIQRICRREMEALGYEPEQTGWRWHWPLCSAGDRLADLRIKVGRGLRKRRVTG